MASPYPAVQVTPAMAEQATAMANRIRNLRNSIREGEGAYIARLGELAVVQHVGGKIMDDHQYDVLSPKGKRIEVKATETTVVPEPHFRVHVCAHNHSQQCDLYFFVRVNVKAGKVWLVGYMGADAFREQATFRKRGEREPDTGWVVKEDSYSLTIAQLRPVPQQAGTDTPAAPPQADTSKPRGAGGLLEAGWQQQVRDGVRIWTHPVKHKWGWVQQHVALGIERGEIPVVREDRVTPVATVPVTDQQVEERKLWRPGMALPHNGEDEDDGEGDPGVLFW